MYYSNCSKNICFILIIFFTSIIFLSDAQNRNLCDTCECHPSALQPTHVNCNCKKNKILLMKDEDGETLSQTQFLNISSCNFLSFPSNGFQKSKKLRSVEIHQMKLFHLNAGIFPALSNLVIEDVDELILDGFQGQNSLSTIEVKRSFLSEIAEDTFKAAKSISKISFVNVSIGSIAPDSISAPYTSNKPLIQFINCKIDEIQTNGISAQVTKLELVNSTINVIHPNGVVINATENINILRSKFGALLSPDGLKLKATTINIMDNEFATLPSSMLADITTHNEKKINFIGNFIHDIDLGGFLLNSKLDKLNFAKNKIMCDCTPRKTSILKLKDLFPGLLTNETYFDGIIENNNCKNYGGIYLSSFRQQFLNGVICNETDFNSLNSVYSSEPTEKWLSLLQPTPTQNSIEETENSATYSNFNIQLIIICIIFLSITISPSLHE